MQPPPPCCTIKCQVGSRLSAASRGHLPLHSAAPACLKSAVCLFVSRTEPDTSGIRIIPELEEEGWFAFGDMWRDIPCESACSGQHQGGAGKADAVHKGHLMLTSSSAGQLTLPAHLACSPCLASSPGLLTCSLPTPPCLHLFR